ncbi:hypothetical protein J4H92_10880 [Leucobacter weissii]|uniref:Uncharacterized protein n=1 Tax=Leucobacter weissii TaxID=1983706 RepID=A0A939MPP6_9MICO|nr:hypothetical protein [Leucobacter weissii]MBO1902452.1 hypothetical protein [Leucobacter weissii]
MMPQNPFEVTKAVDFTDHEIATRFVSFSTEDYPLVDPRSPITQYLVGGKGGGRTHLMRFYSYPLQKDRASGSLLKALKGDGYLGIYVPASGLDGSRFEGAHISDDAWRAVFAQSLEIRLVLLLLDIISDIQATENPWNADELEHLVETGSQLILDFPKLKANSPLANFREALAAVQQNIDAAINNAPLKKSLEVLIRFSPGSLVFGMGSAVQQLQGLDGMKLTYMLDELENLTESQQLFVNTLVREKKLPTCFLIGSREWGIRTQKTLSAGEENKEGSEFRKVVPENAYSQSEEAYKRFCVDMIEKRLRAADLEPQASRDWVRKLEARKTTSLLDDALLDAIGSRDRKHLTRVRKVVLETTRSPEIADQVVAEVRCDEHPLLEKLAILKAFQLWSKEGLFRPGHFQQASEFVRPLATDSAQVEQKNFLNLWKHDMAAQVYADQSVDQPYFGIDTLVGMTGYLPRNLLVILKYITSRATWRDEQPFGEGVVVPISTQSAGVREASSWYLNDVKPLGEIGTHCDRAIRRLGSLLRDIRYSDKPSEVNLTTFSSNLEGLDQQTIKVIESCVKHRMLIEVPMGRQSRNRGSVHRKFKLHPMLSPFFGLGFGRRGDLSLTGDEVSALFSPGSDEAAFQTVAKRRVSPLTAPFKSPAMDQLF